MIVLGLEKAPAGASLHGVGEQGIPAAGIAAALRRSLHLPVTSIDPAGVASHFGWIGTFFQMDLAATSLKTQALPDWHHDGPGLIGDIDAGAYAAAMCVGGADADRTGGRAFIVG